MGQTSAVKTLLFVSITDPFNSFSFSYSALECKLKQKTLSRTKAEKVVNKVKIEFGQKIGKFSQMTRALKIAKSNKLFVSLY